MKKLIATFIFISAIASAAMAQSYMTEEGSAVFYSKVPLHTFSGESENLTGIINLSNSKVDFYIDLTTLETGIEKRDRDMKETLETEKYPFAEFFGELVSDFNPDTTAEQPVTVKGEFKIHGVSQEVTIDGTLQMKPEGLVVKASWILLLEDYDIVPPSLLFVKVDQEQEIEIEALLKPVEN
ncbi:YceI family protein [Gracilimonas sp. BCB1]|uniref:YceI family protein n=1 Tax=Gracilimonas sp. BCB1 TaxID=3152362 RepID=UPI0032D95DFC